MSENCAGGQHMLRTEGLLDFDRLGAAPSRCSVRAARRSRATANRAIAPGSRSSSTALSPSTCPMASAPASTSPCRAAPNTACTTACWSTSPTTASRRRPVRSPHPPVPRQRGHLGAPQPAVFPGAETGACGRGSDGRRSGQPLLDDAPIARHRRAHARLRPQHAGVPHGAPWQAAAEQTTSHQHAIRDTLEKTAGDLAAQIDSQTAKLDTAACRPRREHPARTFPRRKPP